MMMRRRALITPKDGGYVTKGLLLFLDGLNRGGVSGEWKDLVDGKVFAFTGTYTEDTDGVITSNALMENANAFSFATIELVLSVNATGYQCILQSTPADRGVFTTTSGKLQFGGRSSGTGYKRMIIDNPLNTLISVSADYDTANNEYYAFRINNVNSAATNTGVTWNTAAASTRFFKYSGGYPFKGKLCAVRMYNRTLTDAEKTKNYKLDAERYGIS